ncbi:ribonuclease H-like domain-containing protein, partial [Tanacetum coccineum]
RGNENATHSNWATSTIPSHRLSQQAHSVQHGSTVNPTGILGLTPSKVPTQETLLPNAFMTLEDPTWNMDMGASSNLNSNSCNLSIVYNNSLYLSVRVGDRKTILVTNTVHSILHILSRPLCDSLGDLYPVTKPSHDPSALLSVSPATWHQRLRHPGAKVLLSLISRNFISYNKERSSHICNACQLGKHMKLPFVSSDTSVSSSFDIIHSYIWTSPIVIVGAPTAQHQQPVTITHSPTPTGPSHEAYSYTPTDPPTSAQHPPTRTHLMVTRAQVGIVKPNPCFNFYTSHIYPLPKSPSIDVSDPNWRVAMYDEYNALVKNNTWMLVSKPPNANVVRSMWLFRHKYHADGSLSRYKARLVANGHTQQVGIDCDDMFSPVVKPATIRTILSLALSRKWHVHQLDVKNAFLNDDISETVYIYALCVGFSSSRCDSSLFIYQYGTEVAYLLISVDDIVLTASFTDLLQRMFPSKKKYASELLDMAHMANLQQVCLHMHDPREPHLVDLKRVLRYVRGTLDFGLQLYASIIGSLVAYTDVDWADFLTTRSSVEAEYKGVANVVSETAWLRNLLRKLHTPLLFDTLVYCDNCDTNTYDADIKPIYDEEPMAEVQLTAECNIFATGQQHTEQPKIITEGRVDQYTEQCQVQSPIHDSLLDN